MSNSMKWILGVFGVLLLLCCGGGMFLFNTARKAIDETSSQAIKVGDSALADFGATWDPTALRAHGATNLAVTSEQAAKWKSEYGAFKSGTPKAAGVFVKSGSGEAKRITVTYHNNAVFEKKLGFVEMEIVRVDDGPWQVESFDIKADARPPASNSSL